MSDVPRVKTRLENETDEDYLAKNWVAALWFLDNRRKIAQSTLLMSSMDTAPIDGTRVLVQRYVWGFDFAKKRQTRTGHVTVSECWFDSSSNVWREWLGSGVTSTESIDPIGWWPKLDDMVDPKLSDIPGAM